MTVEGSKADGKLQMKIRYNTGDTGTTEAKLPASLPQPNTGAQSLP